MFYIQSAIECAQLLLLASLDESPEELRIHAISDLGWPVSLVDLTLGVLAMHESNAPIYFSGYDPGYEEIPFPGLYDPMTAGEVSPLINAFEAGTSVQPECPLTNAFVAEMSPVPEADRLFQELEATCNRSADPDTVRAALRELSWSVLDATLSSVPDRLLAKMARIVERHSDTLIPDHERILRAMRERLAR